MANSCYNYLTITASTEEAKKQLKDFTLKSKSNGRPFSFDPTFPMPRELDIESGTNQEYGLAIINARNGDDRKLKEILTYPWCRKEGITNLSDLESYLLTHNKADLALGQKAYDNLIKYGVKDWYDWRNENWSTKWDAGEVELYKDEENIFKVFFYTAYNPPYQWIIKISKDYPALKFSDDYNIDWTDTFTEGIFGVQNGIFTEEEVDIDYLDDIISKKFCDYKKGTQLRPVDENGEPLPFKFFVKGPDSVIAYCSESFDVDYPQKSAWDNFKDYDIGLMMNGHREKSKRTPDEQKVYEELEKEYEEERHNPPHVQNVLDSVLIKRKEEKGDIIKHSIDAPSEGKMEASYFFRLNCENVDDAINMSSSVVREVHEQFDKEINGFSS